MVGCESLKQRISLVQGWMFVLVYNMIMQEGYKVKVQIKYNIQIILKWSK